MSQIDKQLASIFTHNLQSKLDDIYNNNKCLATVRECYPEITYIDINPKNEIRFANCFFSEHFEKLGDIAIGCIAPLLFRQIISELGTSGQMKEVDNIVYIRKTKFLRVMSIHKAAEANYHNSVVHANGIIYDIILKIVTFWTPLTPLLQNSIYVQLWDGDFFLLQPHSGKDITTTTV